MSVDDDSSDCIDGGAPDYSSLGTALAAAGSGDIIRVCEGDYTEDAMHINTANITITGPGDTPEADGEAVVHHSGTGGTALVDINSDGVSLSGLTLELGDPLSASGFEISGDNVTVANTEIRNGTGTAMSITGTPSPVDVVVDGNYIHDNGDNVVLYCDSCEVTDNTIAAGDTRGIDLNGDNGIITGNTVTAAWSAVKVSGSDNLVANNTLTSSPDRAAIAVYPGDAVVRDNTLSGSSGTGISVNLNNPPYDDIQVEIIRNTFTNFDTGIELYDGTFGDGFVIDALIGGSEANANTFRSTGGTPTDDDYLLDNDSPSAVSAEYNDWGLCTAAQIAREVNDQSDNTSLGPVDFEPFIEPSGCEEHRRSTATPTDTATPTEAAPTPMSAPMATPPPPIAAATPFGGVEPGVVPPSTGSGPASGGSPGTLLAWLLAGTAGAAIASGWLLRPVRGRRRC